MKLLIAVALAAFVTYVSAQCDNCNTCANPGPLCRMCPVGTVLSNNRQSCLACPTACLNCTADASDVTKCTVCSSGYYLKADACSFCGTGCLKCHEDATNTVICDECTTIGYAQDTTSAVKACVACPTSCKKCNVKTDGTTQCSECYSYKGLGIRGYYLKASDKTCKSCPSFCEKCSDDGNGAGVCANCYATYTLIADASQTTFADNTKCLKCPTTCSQCSGEIKSGNNAKCTTCVADMGNYLTGDECLTCGAGCKNCDSTGQCIECNVDYRLDSGSCIACPPFCKTCAIDASTSTTTCSVCDDKYGVKLSTSVTCDTCGISNCGTCTRSSSTGAMSCTACKTGFNFGSTAGACASCGTGCNACSYNSTAARMECSTCATGYTNNPSIAPSESCTACPSGCATCQYNSGNTANVDCLTCTSTTDYVVTGATPNICSALIANCKTGDATTAGQCTECNEFYYLASATSCSPCIANCKNCTFGMATTCDTNACNDGYVNSANNQQCVACAVGDCKTCVEATAATTCGVCKTGFIRNTASTQCLRCPSNCVTCTQSADVTSCSSGGCKSWDGSKAYIDNAGSCKACPTKCKMCTYDTSSSTTKCSANQCDTGYALTPTGTCDACPSNCNDCQYDTTLAQVVCKSSQCATGYGQKTDKLCYACPNMCSTCSKNADDTLVCSVCKSGYEENSDVCSKCPSNCKTCSDVSGTMTCSACMAGYALDSNAACTKCPTNCKMCTATGTLQCSECNSGYALASDKSACTDCASAATDNCALCSSVDASSGKANCTVCQSGYALEDMEVGGKCKDAGSLSCGSGMIFDNDDECSACKDDFTLMMYKCIKMCYSCGDVNAGVYVPKAQCLIPAAGANATANNANLIPCESGICYVGLSGGNVNAGCLPKADTTGTCTGPRASGETCKSTSTATVCERCCTTEKCNTFVSELDGTPDSATSVAINTLLLAVAAFFALH